MVFIWWVEVGGRGILGLLLVLPWIRYEGSENLSKGLAKQKTGGASEEARVGKEGRDMATKGRKPMKEDQAVRGGIQGHLLHYRQSDHLFPCTNLP